MGIAKRIHPEFVDKQVEGDNIPLSEELRKIERSREGHQYGRDYLRQWVKLSEQNVYQRNADFQHTLRYHLSRITKETEHALKEFGEAVPNELDKAATENDLRFNNPRIDPYNKIGDRVDHVVHHPSYTVAGDLIYGTDLVKKLATPGGMREGMAFYFLANHVGEAGHTCPVICNYETARVLRLVEDFPQREEYLRKLEEPSYTDNFTSSQFLTEVQGGSDVGANDTLAWQDESRDWFIRGEKWFCSNANAELMVISARRDTDKAGTKGLSMFLIPATKPNGERNHFTMRRLKEKMGTRALASAEMDYHDAWAIPLGDNFNFMLEKVIHHSRISLAVAALGMTTRAYQLSRDFASTRHAFGQTIENFPLVKENLSQIKADLTVCFAGTYSLISRQDQADLADAPSTDDTNFNRLMSNIGKSVISKRSVDNVHHCLDGIGGNGAIENTSSLPRLLRDCIIFENWEGTHNTLYMQTLRDILKYQHDESYVRIMRAQIAKIGGAYGDEANLAERALDQLVEALSTLRGLDHALQTLKIASIVTDMANLFYYVSAVLEGIDQYEHHNSQSKLDCATLFASTFLKAGNEVTKDQAYIDLCDRIIQA